VFKIKGGRCLFPHHSKIKNLTVENKNRHGDSACRGMAPKRASKQQQQLNVDQFKLLKKPMDHLGKQINVPGSFWEGRMLPDERDKVYKCTIVDFSLAHKFAPDSSPRKAFKMQEMGIYGTGSHEESDLASTMKRWTHACCMCCSVPCSSPLALLVLPARIRRPNRCFARITVLFNCRDSLLERVGPGQQGWPPSTCSGPWPHHTGMGGY
jgi:hypothetical protein